MRTRIVVTAGAVLVLLVAASTAAATAGSSSAGGPIAGKLRVRLGTTYSTNWSGYAATGTTFTDVKGTWTVPPADCSGVKGQQTTMAVFWAGLDGYVSRTVEQTGTETACVGATPVYFAWYEFYPAGLIALDQTAYPVQPGDTMTAEVSQDGTNVTTTLTSSRGWSKTASMSAAGLDFSSAEWIAEAPSKSLTSFGSVTFSSARASDASHANKAIGSWTNDKVILFNHPGLHGTALLTPGDLTNGGSQFIITQAS